MKSSCFDHIGDGKYGMFLSLEVDDIYWLLRSSRFELFGDGKYSLFSAKKLMER